MTVITKCGVCLHIIEPAQIYLDDDQAARLDERAATEGTSRSDVIRRAIAAYLPQQEEDVAAWQTQWKKAVESTAGIAPYLDEGAE